ncbi:DUF1090 domain-containing protein [Salmonella enterica subsp. enterica serovar Oranienburg]|nr:DUF1090 domain-containing protein [Salmonella enterica subsp. enterica serovar Oranienburg]
MKPRYLRATILTGLIYSVMSPGALAGGYHECEYKRQHLEHQLEYAQAYNNFHRMAGLQRALRHIDEYCNRNLYQPKAGRVAEKQRKVTRRLHELEQARLSGKNEKIADGLAKLAEAREELAEARHELSHNDLHSKVQF